MFTSEKNPSPNDNLCERLCPSFEMSWHSKLVYHDGWWSDQAIELSWENIQPADCWQTRTEGEMHSSHWWRKACFEQIRLFISLIRGVAVMVKFENRHEIHIHIHIQIQILHSWFSALSFNLNPLSRSTCGRWQKLTHRYLHSRLSISNHKTKAQIMLKTLMIYSLQFRTGCHADFWSTDPTRKHTPTHFNLAFAGCYL
jgi:hypothetical protein